MTGAGAWSDAYNKAVDFVRQLTIEEKVCSYLLNVQSQQIRLRYIRSTLHQAFLHRRVAQAQSMVALVILMAFPE